MAEKTNKELYAELAVKLKAVEDKMSEAESFANENKLHFSFWGGSFIPANTEEVRDNYSEEMEPVEDISPSEDYGFYEDCKGSLWFPSTC